MGRRTPSDYRITGLHPNYEPHRRNARKSIGLQILILGAAELQIRQNRASDRWFVRTGAAE